MSLGTNLSKAADDMWSDACHRISWLRPVDDAVGCRLARSWPLSHLHRGRLAMCSMFVGPAQASRFHLCAGQTAGLADIWISQTGYCEKQEACIGLEQTTRKGSSTSLATGRGCIICLGCPMGSSSINNKAYLYRRIFGFRPFADLLPT